MGSYISASREKELGKQFSTLFQGYNGPAFAIRLWNGWQCAPTPGAVGCTLVIQSPNVFASLAAGADEVTLGEAFVHKELEVEGDLFAAFSVAQHLFELPRGVRQWISEKMMAGALHLRRWMQDGRRHSRGRDLASVSFHYDLPVEFYRPWLGPTLAYSCAYFRRGDECLDEAQQEKLDLICRKLRLKRDERFLDIGCGWGSLVLNAARYCGQAYGITLSREQARVANVRVRAAGLLDSCRAEFRDYRSCGELAGTFDKVASVGMFEHVGLPNLGTYFASVWTLMKPGGTFLNHGIVRSQSSPSRRNSFIDRFVFPDGRLVTLTDVIRAAEEAGFEVRDVENLREHYERTLRQWVDGLKRNKDELLKIVPETTYRTWLLYTAGSAAAFQRGQIAVHQVLLSRLNQGKSCLPLVREDWYAPDARCGRAPIETALRNAN